VESDGLDWGGILRWIDDRMLYIEDFISVIRFMIIVFNVILTFIFMLVVLERGSRIFVESWSCQFDSLPGSRSCTYAKRLEVVSVPPRTFPVFPGGSRFMSGAEVVDSNGGRPGNGFTGAGGLDSGGGRGFKSFESYLQFE
jgi:uncharacterized membrane protein YgcG